MQALLPEIYIQKQTQHASCLCVHNPKDDSWTSIALSKTSTDTTLDENQEPDAPEDFAVLDTDERLMAPGRLTTEKIRCRLRVPAAVCASIVA